MSYCGISIEWVIPRIRWDLGIDFGVSADFYCNTEGVYRFGFVFMVKCSENVERKTAEPKINKKFCHFRRNSLFANIISVGKKEILNPAAGILGFRYLHDIGID